jgi:hypothetical protein
MHFRVAKFIDRIPNNSLLYRPEEYSFDVSPVPEGGIWSVLFDDLNLELNGAGKVISVEAEAGKARDSDECAGQTVH